MYPAPALEDPEDRGLAPRTPPAAARHAVGAEVALVHLDLADEGTLVGGKKGHALPEERVEAERRLAVQAAELGRLNRRKICAEILEHLPELDFTHARVAQITVFLRHRSTLHGALNGLIWTRPFEIYFTRHFPRAQAHTRTLATLPQHDPRSTREDRQAVPRPPEVADRKASRNVDLESNDYDLM